MPKLIIVAGASGAGKTFMLSQLSSYRNDIITIKKYTTRGPRKDESSNETRDLYLNCDDCNVRKCDYTYRYCGHNYGVKKSDIDRILKLDKNPVVIVSNCTAISKIKKDYPSALVFYVQSGLSGNDLKSKLLQYRDPMDVEERMKRQKSGFNDYVQHMNKKLFDYILVNYYDDTFMQQIEYILEDELISTVEANYIFVIMSFDSKYDEVYEAIKAGGERVRDKKLLVQRVSEASGDYIITDRIETSIEKAGAIICDVSEISPNVYYELGYARAKKKHIILTAARGTELPFDVRQYKTNFYDSAFHLQKFIEKELTYYFCN